MNDVQQIQAVICRYSDLLTTRNWDGLNDIFTEDATWEIIGTEYRFDSGNVPAGLRSTVEPTSFIMQNMSPAIVEIDGDEASARSNVYEVVEIPAMGQCLNIYGIYEDRLRRANGQWRFASRRFNQLKTVATPLTEG